MKKFITLTLIILACSAISAQTFNGIGGSIPSTGNPANFSINVGTLGTAILDTNFGVLNVGITITHPYDLEG